MATKPHRRKARGEGHTRREEILAAAKELILAGGIERASIRNIAARLGVSATTLYLYFPDRDTIMLELCDRAFSGLVAQVSDIVGEGGDPLAALRRLMEAYIRFGIEHPDEYRLIFMVKEALPIAIDLDAPAAPATTGALGVQAFGAMLGLVSRLAAEGVLIGDDPMKMTQMIWMAGHGMVSLLITMPWFPWAETEDLIRSQVEMPLRGLLADPAAKG